MGCEYLFKGFYTKGSNEYIHAWAADIDRLAEAGWEVLGSVRCPGIPFEWTVCLYRDTQPSQSAQRVWSNAGTVDAIVGRAYDQTMAISARNQLRGTVSDVVLGNVMAHVTVQVGENVIESMISRKSAEELRLKKGDKVVVIIKSTEVMIQKD
jgi:molybdopterin-binding protein